MGGLGQVPEPPKQGSVDVRTQNSDIQSVKQSGGAGAPESKQFNLGEINIPPANPSLNNSMPNNSGFGEASPLSGIPDISGNSSANPSSSNNPFPSSPQVGMETPPQSSVAPEKDGIDWKKIGIIIGSIIIVAALAYIGYIFIYPAIFSSNTPPPSETAGEPTLPKVEESENVLPLVNQVPVHSSYLNSATPLGSLQFSPLTFKQDLTSLVSSIIAIPPTPVIPPSVNETTEKVYELQIQKDNQQINFSEFFSSFFSQFTSEALSEKFKNDFTAFVYTDKDSNAWPGYIAKLKPTANLFESQSLIQQIESSFNFSNIFIEDEGTISSGGFLDGQVNSIPTRYITFSNSKAAIDYMWLGDYFIISTSYPGLKAVVPLLIQ